VWIYPHSWRSCPAAAFGSAVSGKPSRGFGHDRQAALFTDNEELNTDALLRLAHRGSRPRTIALFDHPNERAEHPLRTTAPEAIPPVGAIGLAQVRAAELSKERPRSYTAARRCYVASDLEAIDGNQNYAPPKADLAGLTQRGDLAIGSTLPSVLPFAAAPGEHLANRMTVVGVASELEFLGGPDQLELRGDVELGVDVAEMAFHGSLRDRQVLGDLPSGVSLGRQARHLAFPAGKG
jgi:hypothetical protein